MKHLFSYKWYLKDGYPAKGITKNKYNIFGTFICGGGSTMGYKLAGFNHLGGVEIDNKMSEVYKLNHSPKYLYNEDIRNFNKRNDLPKELYELDILDGSPPCSSFSMAGNREKDWSKEKVFREGQAKQSLDDLVFIYCDTIIKLKPKIFILENVKGIIQGNAKLYSKQIVDKMTKVGYTIQVFCLNAASMGVPQKRERVFFIGHKKEYKLPKMKLAFNEKSVIFSEIDTKTEKGKITANAKELWNKCNIGKSFSSVHKTGAWFNAIKINPRQVLPTITGVASSGGQMYHYKHPRELNNTEYILSGSYPLDYNFDKIEPKYLIGMSVPPVMTAQIANQIKIQWLDKI